MKKFKNSILICLLLLTALYCFYSTKYLKIIWKNTEEKRTRLKALFEKHTATVKTCSPSAQVKATSEGGPATDIVFLKTHKTGGTTLQNILYRKAYKENLTIGVPSSGNSMFLNFLGKKFTRGSLEPCANVNMLISHMIFNYKEVSAVMSSQTIYIAMLREPGKQFESAFNYLYDRVPAFKKATGKLPMLDYLKNARKYLGGIRDPRGIWWQGKNGIFYEFGYDNLSESEDYIKNAVEKINEIFDFVLILEYFDMSLLILMDLLHWDMEDMLYLKMNVRDTSTVQKLDSNTTRLIYDWNKADVALYKHFNQTFWRRVERYGKERMTENLSRFRKMKEEYKKRCIETVISVNKTLNASNKKDRTVYRYVLKDSAKQNSICVGMATEESEWFKYSLAKQRSTA